MTGAMKEDPDENDVSEGSVDPFSPHNSPQDDTASISPFSQHGSSSSDDDDEEEDESSVHMEIPTRKKTIAPLAHKETRYVRILRVIVLFILATGTFAAAVAVFYKSTREEIDRFEEHFAQFADSLDENWRQVLHHRLEAMDALAVQLTGLAQVDNQTFPFVTLPDFGTRGIGTLQHADSSILYAPLVVEGLRERWEVYSDHYQDWIDTGYKIQQWVNRQYQQQRHLQQQRPSRISTQILTSVPSGNLSAQDLIDPGPGPYMPIWQASPIPGDTSIFNVNLLTALQDTTGLETMMSSQQVILGAFEGGDPDYSRQPENNNLEPSPPLMGISPQTPGVLRGDDHLENQTQSIIIPQSQNDPISALYYPVFDSFATDRAVAGTLLSQVHWRTLLEETIPDDSGVGITLVLQNGCDQIQTFRADGDQVVYEGEGDLHNDKYSTDGVFSDLLISPNYQGEPLNTNHCPWSLSIYPSADTEDSFRSQYPAIYTGLVVLAFVCTSIIFMAFDCMVERRNRMIMEMALRSDAIVSSIFPTAVQERLYHNTNKDDSESNSSTHHSRQREHYKTVLAKLDDNSEQTLTARNGFLKRKSSRPKRLKKRKSSKKKKGQLHSKPIADLFPTTTVFFADIVGFSAWSFEREPAQVFTLLETLYSAFDEIAKKRSVYKVETVGDCYVAITGCPEPQKNHAVIMARFAKDCLRRMNYLTRKLESTLGPDTGDLSLRIGVHSGPVTAGVLRGEKARFQLFGDTVNTASRMGSNGERSRIHASQQFADALAEAGKGQWAKPRPELVWAKGKGDLQTYWIELRKSSHDSSAGSLTSSIMSLDWDMSEEFESTEFANDDDHDNSTILGGGALRKRLSDKTLRLVDWNTELLLELLKKLHVSRRANRSWWDYSIRNIDLGTKKDATVLDELTEILHLPRYDARTAKQMEVDLETVKIGDAVVEQLKDFVLNVASMYLEDNPFHNFEHASHVTMSVQKMLARIVAADHLQTTKSSDTAEATAADLHQHTYGITSDPLTHFAVLFSALIHDVDHPGVSNFLLVNENADIAARYKGKSVLEQNSVDVAWDLLMRPSYTELRRCLLPDESELRRFRQLVVNIVLSTDIFDKDFSAMRKRRWEKAFAASTMNKTLTEDEVDQRATIVIEHIMQASDVAHTMQHFSTYKKWNKRLFREVYKAHKSGRISQDPTAGWYMGELTFFDNYVIPLAKKIRECRVFGVKGDQCVTNAITNRQLWAAEGKALVAEMVSEAAEDFRN